VRTKRAPQPARTGANTKASIKIRGDLGANVDLKISVEGEFETREFSKEVGPKMTPTKLVVPGVRATAMAPNYLTQSSGPERRTGESAVRDRIARLREQHDSVHRHGRVRRLHRGGTV
jgi:hypothetical protein